VVPGLAAASLVPQYYILGYATANLPVLCINPGADSARYLLDFAIPGCL